MKNVAIIGAGLSGLAGAKVYAQEGFQVNVYEKDTELGGVWSGSNRYPRVTTQNPRDTYAFSDYPMPSDYPEFPTGEQVQQYLQGYAEHFGLMELIHFSTRLVKAEPDEEGWLLTLENTQTQEQQTERVHLLLLANGTFHEPHVPALPGQDAFVANGGQVLHSTQWKSEAQLAGKRVVVVGGGKSGSDVANYAADIAQAVTLVERKRVWRIPYYINNKTSVADALTHRMGESLFPYYRNKGLFGFFHGAGNGLRKFQEKMIMKTLEKQYNLTALGMLPQKPVTQSGGSCNIGLEPIGFYKAIQEGRITAKLGGAKGFTEKGLTLDNGEVLEADIVVMATGFEMTFPFFSEALAQKLYFSNGDFRLFRAILPTQVANLAFIGYNTSLYTPLTSEMGAVWSALYFKGEMKLPGTEAMEAELQEYLQWMHQHFPTHNSGGLCKGPFTTRYLDELMADMGVRHRRASFRQEWFKTFDPGRYKNVIEEARA